MTEGNTDEQDRKDMSRLAAGEDAALNAIMERHAGRLFQFLLRMVQNETTASDLTEETFVRVYQNRDRFNPSRRFSTWCFTIAANLARDEQRYRARHPNISLDTPVTESGQQLGDVIPETRPGPAHAMQAEERANAVRKAIAGLPEDLRVALVLFEYEEKSQAEIAAILDCSPKAVEMRLYRARQELRQKLSHLLPDEKSGTDS